MNGLSRWSRAVASAFGALAICTAAPVAATLAPGAVVDMATDVAVAYGTVRSIETLAKDTPRGNGAILGGIIGAMIGRQIGDTSAEKNMGTVIGAAAGAAIGHEIEKNARRETGGVRIIVTLDDGSIRRFDFRETGGLRIGDRVRVEGNNLFRIV